MKELRSDVEIIKEIQMGNNVTDNFQIISDRHSAIFYKMADRWISKQFREKRLDFFKDKDYYIFKVILDFKDDQNMKFSTYLANRIMWMCMNNYNKDLNCCEVNCPDQIIYNCPDNSDQIDINAVCEVMDMIKKDKDKRIHKIFTLRYLVGKDNKLMPWKDICKDKDVNLSVQGCINVHDKYIKKRRKEN